LGETSKQKRLLAASKHRGEFVGSGEPSYGAIRIKKRRSGAARMPPGEASEDREGGGSPGGV